jgi:hypothetical protein
MPDGVDCRSHHLIGIHELNGKIVFLHSVLGDVPEEQITKNTVFPQYIIADFFSADFGEHTQKHLVYSENKTLFETCCECRPVEDYLLLNTLRYSPSGGGLYRENDRHNTLARLIEIRGDGDYSLREIGESPEPVEKIHSDGKTYVFGDYTVRMASQFTVECASRTTGEVIWKLRLTAYLYTDIEEKNDMLYFCTAGKGGRFYGVSLRDGRVLFACDTGGTVRCVWCGENALVIDRKGDIVRLDSKTGAEIKRFDFRKQKLRALPHMLIKDGGLYTAASHNKNFYNFYAARVDL